MEDFEVLFFWLTGHSPFPWQIKLHNELIAGSLRKTCPIPTGLGKTSIIPIWLLALAFHVTKGSMNGFPRRLVYVVNRRTVVDQATRDAEGIRDALLAKPELSAVAQILSSLQILSQNTPLAISTLRGQFADNAEWRVDPARPAVIIGTVDMIGSRLLFSGYGCGFKSRPLHAGFLGQDTLLVHDEAHLEPAFQELVAGIALEQQRWGELRRIHVMEMTATSRSDSDGDDSLFTPHDEAHGGVSKRINARKGISFHEVEDEKKTAEEVMHRAKSFADSGQAILVYLRKVVDVNKVADSLRKIAPEKVAALTGTLRGWERDALATRDPVFARFMDLPDATPQEGTVYLVCTSAGEVGVNISGDNLVCDLTPFDSMMQRFGRVNRFGKGDAHIEIVHRDFNGETRAPSADSHSPDSTTGLGSSSHGNEPAETKASKKKNKLPSPFEISCQRTITLLQRLPLREDDRRDASPGALRAISASERQAAFTPSPGILAVTDILFDAWALTTIRDRLPARPPVADWLHGLAEWEPPVAYVAWREEVELVIDELLEKHPPDELLADYPLKPHEILRDQEDRVRRELEKIAARHPEKPVWLIDSDGRVREYLLKDLVEKDKQKKPVVRLADCTVLLPPSAGGLERGLLNGDVTSPADDIADLLLDENGEARRSRTWDDLKPKGMRLVRTVEIGLDPDEELEDAEQNGRQWRWYVRPRSADDDGSRTARAKQLLKAHLTSAGDFAAKLVAGLGLREPESLAVVLAARWHDLGKNRPVWQHAIGNRAYPGEVWAKSGLGMRPLALNDYRHELGSLLDLATMPEFQELSKDVQDLVVHLIAAHHGRARPHFPDSERFDHNRPEEEVAGVVAGIPGRFARLQRRYGRWGLAYLESLVRAADIMASQDDNKG
jgi:CRISPR-associated endonuclease/helicase Cas3